MEIVGYLASALIGISLALIGGGGSILTIPVLVYLFGISPLLATSYSLFIVGSTSLIGSVNNYKKGHINVKAALYFGTASIITVFLTRKFIVPVIPVELFSINGFTVTEPFLTMILFGILMLMASISMINDKKSTEAKKEQTIFARFFGLVGYGVGIGLVTGLLGAGGGFLLIPALVLIIGMPMKQAVSTSLLIITLNSLIGFTGDIGHFNIDWIFLLSVTAMAVAGVFIGALISRKIEGEKLKKGFGSFVLLMGIYIIIKEITG